jgi:acylphosphatase
MTARRFIVKGRVQGVGFRYFTIHAARACRVVGTVRNLPDGTVEAIAEGSSDSIDEFRKRLWEGPSFSNVTMVEETELLVSRRYTVFDVEY